MQKLTELVERILKLLSLITLLVTAVGFIHMVWYYHSYNIPISQYINLSEIFLYSLSNVAIFLFAFLLPIIFIITAFLNRKNLEYYNLNRLGIIVQEGAFFLICAIAYFILYGFRDIIGETALRCSNICYFLVLFVFLTLYSFDYKDIVMNKGLNNVLKISYIVGLAAGFTMLIGTVLNGKNLPLGYHKSVYLKLNDTTIIKTSDSIRYVGKTDGYYFLYNMKSKESIIYPSSQIQQVKIINTLKTKE